MPHDKSFIDQASSVKMAGYWPHSFISTYLYRMTISVIVVTAINMGPVFTTQRTATTPGTSRPTLFE